MATPPGLSVSLVLYGSALPQVAATLRALAAQTVPPPAVVVRVNADPDGSVSAAVRRLAAEAYPRPGLRVTAEPTNTGYSGAHNRSCAELFADGAAAVLLLNPDLALAPTALAQLARRCAQEPRALHGPLLLLADPETLTATDRVDTAGIRWTVGGRHLDRLQGRPATEAPTEPYRVAGISGACLAVPRAAWLALVAVGGELLDETFVAYREDAELGFRARLLGLECWVDPAARGSHARRLRGTDRSVSDQLNLLSVRNRFLFAFKYGPDRPGGRVGPLLRDAVVIGGVLARERSSLPGLRQAWHLRHEVRRKGRVIRAQATRSPRQATRP